MKVRNAVIAGAVSLAAAAALSSPAYAATQRHHPGPSGHSRRNDCSLSVSNSRPRPGDQETLTVWTDAGRSTVDVRAVGPDWLITTNRNGVAWRNFTVGRPGRHRTVVLVGQVINAPRGYRTGATCYTSYTVR